MNTHNPFVCVVDDDALIRESLWNLFRSAGLRVQTFASAQEFLTRRPSESPGCLVLDVRMPGITGLELQRELGGDSRIPIIFMTGHGDIPTSVRAMKAGAFEFLTKPCNDVDLLRTVNQAIQRGPLIEEEESAKRGACSEHKPGQEADFSEIVGVSPALRNVLRQVAMVAASNATVLILGETGTGKELITRAIHQNSLRKDQPLVRVNCGSIPKELFESEFFGHVRGAFTSALRDRIGRFEAASGGTLFLDEVGEIPLELQSKLLRVLQEKAYERVGDTTSRTANVRIVAATNRDLKKELQAGRFREDLYYRLNVFPIKVAPLRDRKDDIPLLASHFIETVVKELRCPRPRLTRAGTETLLNYDWPGNIRELCNVIQRAAIFAQGGALQFDLPVGNSPAEPASSRTAHGNGVNAEYMTEAELRRRERENIFAVLQKTGWKIKGFDGAAQLLGVSPTTLFARMQKMGLKKPAISEQQNVGAASQI
jgi:DNA-binding NtrC family response regulator